MIAVFAKDQKVFNENDYLPRKMFRYIRTVSDIRGVKFDGIILMYAWYEDSEKREAFDALKHRQPELFKEEKL